MSNKYSVSVLIPSLNEELYLNKTIQNVLENARGDIEVIPILDGWEPTSRIDDPRGPKAVYKRGCPDGYW